MAGQPITDEQRELVGKLIENGHSRNQVAKIVGISTGSVSKIAQQLGLGWDSKAAATVKTATAGRKAQLTAKRALLEEKLVDDAERLRRLIWTPTVYRQAVGGREPTILTWDQDTPNPQDQLRLMQAAGLAIDKAQRIADAAGDEGTEAAKSMLAGLFEAMRAAHDTITQETADA